MPHWPAVVTDTAVTDTAVCTGVCSSARRWVGIYPPSYWYNPPVVVQSAPSVYIERDAAPAAPEDEAYYWYHCGRPEGYYPYIKECPGGWQKVVPTPPQ